MGFAYGSFSVSEIDQGIHIILPVTDEAGKQENDIFTSLFEEYIDNIPKLVHLENIDQVFMGAIAAFAVDNQLDLITEGASLIEAYKRAIR